MTAWSAITRVDGLERAEALVAALDVLEPGAVGYFEIEDGALIYEVGAHFEARPDPVTLALIAAAGGAPDFILSEVPDEDWVAKVQRDLPPVVAGRFFVHGSHDAGKVPAGAAGLLIEAAMAFGTGHHGTTKGCLLALEALAEAGVVPGRVADIGCGTAVLAMAAAHLWPGAAIIASDIDEVAVAVAAANLGANGLAGRIALAEAAGFDAPRIEAAGPFDLILANILAEPLIALAPDMARHVEEGGHVILSGLLTLQKDRVLADYLRCGFNLQSVGVIGDWATLSLVKAG